jgi:hypothetical protein
MGKPAYRHVSRDPRTVAVLAPIVLLNHEVGIDRAIQCMVLAGGSQAEVLESGKSREVGRRESGPKH